MNTPNPELKNIIEAALLVAGKPLTIDKMLTMFPVESQPTREEIRDVIRQLEKEYDNRAVELKQIDRAWRFQTRDKYSPWISRLAEERPVRYSRALLETLAIIVYRQPVTRGDIENIRGVSVSTDIIKTLIGREWIRQVGVRKVPGHPALYGTTREFLEHFNLKSLEELPPLSALRELDVISQELNLRLDFETDKKMLSPTSETANDEIHGSTEDEPEHAVMNEARSAERE